MAGGRELWTVSDDRDVQMRALCANFHDYGRAGGWEWIPRLGDNGDVTARIPGYAHPDGTWGLPLVQGTCRATNCGGFNAGLRQIARLILDFNFFEIDGSSTPASFLTLPGTTVIDGRWHGNVCTPAAGFDALRCFKFTAHSWSKTQSGLRWDASTNTLGFHREDDLMWCRLHKFTEDWFEVERLQGPPLPGGPPHYLARIGVLHQAFPRLPVQGAPLTRTSVAALPAMRRHWPSWILLDFISVPLGMLPYRGMQRVNRRR